MALTPSSIVGARSPDSFCTIPGTRAPLRPHSTPAARPGALKTGQWSATTLRLANNCCVYKGEQIHNAFDRLVILLRPCLWCAACVDFAHTRGAWIAHMHARREPTCTMQIGHLWPCACSSHRNVALPEMPVFTWICYTKAMAPGWGSSRLHSKNYRSCRCFDETNIIASCHTVAAHDTWIDSSDELWKVALNQLCFIITLTRRQR